MLSGPNGEHMLCLVSLLLLSEHDAQAQKQYHVGVQMCHMLGIAHVY